MRVGRNDGRSAIGLRSRYPELTLRRDLPLATLDEDLRTAAAAEKVPLLGVR